MKKKVLVSGLVRVVAYSCLLHVCGPVRVMEYSSVLKRGFLQKLFKGIEGNNINKSIHIISSASCLLKQGEPQPKY